MRYAHEETYLRMTRKKENNKTEKKAKRQGVRNRDDDETIYIWYIV